MDNYVIADNICKFCQQKQITVEQLAEAIGKSTRQVNRYRNAQCKNISVSTLSEIAKTLQISLAELIS